MIRLNIGAGDVPLDGYIPVDRKTGGEACPLRVPGGPWEDAAVPDESVDEIRASHVLEHFSHRETAIVLREWVRALKPGGILKIAVPDIDRCYKAKMAGMPWPFEKFVMGAQVDENDVHLAIFDEHTTTTMMRSAGLRHIRHWKSEIKDCASLPISLNLQGTKAGKVVCASTIAILSAPRLGFTAHFNCSGAAFRSLGIRDICKGGAFWQKGLTLGIEEAIDAGAEYVLTTDYDTIFLPQHVEDLHRLMQDSDADAICAVEIQRGMNRVLASLMDESGNYKSATVEDFEPELTRLMSGHFGLTLIRASVFAKLSKPWFQCIPDNDGRWTEQSTDADMMFWKQFRETGFKLYLANHVAIGQVQEVFTFPDMAFNPIHMYPNDYHRSGLPSNARR